MVWVAVAGAAGLVVVALVVLVATGGAQLDALLTRGPATPPPAEPPTGRG